MEDLRDCQADGEGSGGWDGSSEGWEELGERRAELEEVFLVDLAAVEELSDLRALVFEVLLDLGQVQSRKLAEETLLLLAGEGVLGLAFCWFVLGVGPGSWLNLAIEHETSNEVIAMVVLQLAYTLFYLCFFGGCAGIGGVALYIAAESNLNRFFDFSMQGV